MCRLARLGELGSPGRATSAPKYKNDEGGDVFSFKKLPPLIQKRKLTGLTDFAALRSPFFAFLIPFCSIIRLQQVSTSFLGFLAFH